MPYWRAAGMTYVGYANACAVLVRKCMKEPFKSQTATRERVHFKLSQWLDGVAQPSSKLIPLLLLLLLLMLSSSSSFVLLCKNNSSFFFFFLLRKALVVVQVFFFPPSYITPIPIGRESRCFFVWGEGFVLGEFSYFFPT
jgi:F-type H+-transporting ATPase subunit epsilon